jgi:hypothetical protein
MVELTVNHYGEIMSITTEDRDLRTAPLDVPTAIIQRRSIKAFKPDPISPELLKDLIA